MRHRRPQRGELAFRRAGQAIGIRSLVALLATALVAGAATAGFAADKPRPSTTARQSAVPHAAVSARPSAVPHPARPPRRQSAVPHPPVMPPADLAPARVPKISPGPVQQSTGPTQVLDRPTHDLLLGATGVTLQWIGWDQRGPVSVTEEGGVVRISASQAQPDGPGRLLVEGEAREIGEGYFVLEGTIAITDTPEAGRACTATKPWRFAVTQKRRYFRLREFEWCDGLIDYVDIYF